MKTFCIFFATLFFSLALQAQEEEFRNGILPVATFEPDTPQYADSLHLPAVDYLGRVPHRFYAPYFSGYGLWDLHEGLNANLGLSAFTSFGKNAFSGWAQNVAAIYAKPVNDRFSIALGGYIQNLSSGIGSWREAGLTAMLNYRFNEHWEAFLYGQKSLTNSADGRFAQPSLFYSPVGYYPYGLPLYNGGDKIGLGLRYNFSDDVFIQMLFEYQHLPDPHRDLQTRWPHP